MYAIIEDGSHQYRVSEGDHVRVDRRDGKAGDEVVFPKVLLISGNPVGSDHRNPPDRWRPSGCDCCGPVPHQEDHHSEVSSAQEHAATTGPPPALHHGPDHQFGPAS